MLTVPFALLGAFVAVYALYQLALAVAAFFYREESAAKEATSSTPRVVVLVPAHNEEALIAGCIKSLHSQTYPKDWYEVVVVADNCTDDTAANARAAGADVLVRHEPDARGKGRALRWAIDRVLARVPPPDAIVVVDADSNASQGFLATLAAPLARGAAAVQGESLLLPDGSPHSEARAAAFLLVNRVRPAGRAVLGLACNLAGNGMLFTRSLLLSHPWDAFVSTEDVEYSITLRLAGIRPVFAGGATVYSPTAPNPEAAAQQQLRWEGGKLHVARTQIPKILAAAVRRRSPSLLEAAFELSVPPLGILAAFAVVGAATSAALAVVGLVAAWTLAFWLVAIVAIPLYVFVGLRAARAPRSAYRSLLRAPVFMLRKVAGLPKLLRFRADSWVRTER